MKDKKYIIYHLDLRASKQRVTRRFLVKFHVEKVRVPHLTWSTLRSSMPKNIVN